MKKKFKVLGMLISVALVILGILIMTGVFSDSASYPRTAGTSYDSGFATFGADFYNYVCNNSAEAASAARSAAYNVADLINIITNGCGLIVMALGLLSFCFFGMMPTGPIMVQNVVYAAPAPISVPSTAATVVEVKSVESETKPCEETTETPEA